MEFAVNTEQVLRCSSRLKHLEQRAADIKTLAADADPEWYIWGMVGANFAGSYWQLADEIHHGLDQLGRALSSRIEALDACADNYAVQDKAAAEALKGIEELLK